MSAVRVTLRVPRRDVTHWLSMGGFSVLLHVTIFAAVLFVPQFFRNGTRFPEVYSVDLVSLPAGLPGPPARGPAAAAPPAPAPRQPPRPAVKIPEKPEAKAPKPKPRRKVEPPKPKPEKTEAKPAPQETQAPPASEEGGEGAAEKATPGASPGGLSGGAGGGGGSGFLDDASFAYGWYLSNMTSILGRNWARPIKPDLDHTLRAVVHFRVLKDGTLTDIELEQPSGDPILDRSALRAVQDSNPLPPLPYQYGKDSLGVHFFFDLKPD